MLIGLMLHPLRSSLLLLTLRQDRSWLACAAESLFGKPIPEMNGSLTRDSTSCSLRRYSTARLIRIHAQSMTRAMIEKCTTGLGCFTSDLHTESLSPEAASIAQRK